MVQIDTEIQFTQPKIREPETFDVNAMDARVRRLDNPNVTLHDFISVYEDLEPQSLHRGKFYDIHKKQAVKIFEKEQERAIDLVKRSSIAKAKDRHADRVAEFMKTAPAEWSKALEYQLLTLDQFEVLVNLLKVVDEGLEAKYGYNSGQEMGNFVSRAFRVVTRAVKRMFAGKQ